MDYMAANKTSTMFGPGLNAETVHILFEGKYPQGTLKLC